MDVINMMAAEEYAEFYPRAFKEIIRIQASPNSAFETTPYGMSLLVEEVEKKEEKKESKSRRIHCSPPRGRRKRIRFATSTISSSSLLSSSTPASKGTAIFTTVVFSPWPLLSSWTSCSSWHTIASKSRIKSGPERSQSNIVILFFFLENSL
ncbi:unnamed protein product [Caenorhabditis nigoni]